MKVYTPCCGLVVEVEVPEFSATSVEIPTPCDCEPMAASVIVRRSAVQEVSRYEAYRVAGGLVWMGG